MSCTYLLQVMDVHKGDAEKRFDPTNKKQLADIVKFILDKINAGFLFYGGVRGGEFQKLADRSTIRDGQTIEKLLLENDSFMMQEEVKLLLAPAPMGG